MQFLHILSVVFGFAYLVNALPGAVRTTPVYHPRQAHGLQARHVRTMRPVHAASAVGPASALADSASAYKIENFELSKMELSSTVAHGTKSENLSFTFLDRNSNTSTHCNQTFSATPSPTDPTKFVVPTNYVLCDHPMTFPNSTLGYEFFQFHLTTFNSLTDFGLTLAHEFNDPAHFEAPWTQVEYFADVNVTMVCKDADSAGVEKKCGLQDVNGEGVLTAVVNWISN